MPGDTRFEASARKNKNRRGYGSRARFRHQLKEAVSLRTRLPTRAQPPLIPFTPAACRCAIFLFNGRIVLAPA
jgi:hypothetical protein